MSKLSNAKKSCLIRTEDLCAANRTQAAHFDSDLQVEWNKFVLDVNGNYDKKKLT